MASFTIPCPKSSSIIALKGSPLQDPQLLHHSQIFFPSRSSFATGSAFTSVSQAPKLDHQSIWKVQAQVKDVVEEKSLNSILVPETKAESDVSDTSSISAFMAQVSELVKLVDSRDIMELQLKQLDCELVIRKKEALPQPPAAAPVIMMQHSSPPPPESYAPVSPPPTSKAAAPALSAPVKTNKSSHPPMKSPMAGTFYRSPAPGEPAFVKVGDQVKKGQVICIIEAMKLMNEIEADQSGTIVEIVAEDGKPVSLDTPLVVIQP